MASQGPLFPASGTSVTSGDANEVTWTNPGNIVDSDTDEATITAATFDSPDPSFYLVGKNFGFSIPTDATIDGILVQIERRSIIANSGVDNELMVGVDGSISGDNKASATVWPTTLTMATYGSETDDWNAGLTPANINDTDFCVRLQAKANITNADIGVSWFRVTVYYTEAAAVVTPGTASLTTTRFTPKVTIDQKFTPGVAALVTTRFSPTVRLGFIVVPGVASLTTTRFTPSVTVSNNVLVVPGIATLTTTRFTPTVQTDTKVIPGIGTLTTSRFAPSVIVDQKFIPGLATLVLTTFTPIVEVDTGGVVVTPGTATLTLTRFTPTVLTPRLVTPGVGALALTGFAPTVLTPRLVVPGVGTMTLTRFAPTVLTPRLVIPGKGTLVLTPFSPTLTILTPEVFGELFPFEFLRHVALVSESSDSAYPSEG